MLQYAEKVEKFLKKLTSVGFWINLEKAKQFYKMLKKLLNIAKCWKHNYCCCKKFKTSINFECVKKLL